MTWSLTGEQVEGVGLVVLAYLCGSIPFGVIVARSVRGVDVRTQGSGNIGATNVARVAGKRLGVFVLLLDAAKGAAPVWLAMRLVVDRPWVYAAVGFAAFVGHVFPVWLRFRGGKGVATALGVLVVWVPLAALCGVLLYVLTVTWLRVSSVGSLVGTAGATAAAFLTHAPGPAQLLCCTLTLAVVFTHRSNLARLWRRAERRF